MSLDIWSAITRKKRTRDAYKKFFTSEPGKTVLADLRIFCGYDHPILDTGDMNTTISRLGARSVFLRILKKAALTDEQIEAQTQGVQVEPSS